MFIGGPLHGRVQQWAVPPKMFSCLDASKPLRWDVREHEPLPRLMYVRCPVDIPRPGNDLALYILEEERAPVDVVRGMLRDADEETAALLAEMHHVAMEALTGGRSLKHPYSVVDKWIKAAGDDARGDRRYELFHKWEKPQKA